MKTKNIKMWYKVFNFWLFGNKLPADMPITKTRSKKYLGMFESDVVLVDDEVEAHYAIEVSKVLNTNSDEYKATLIHEMIHAYQFVLNLPVDHKKFFRKEAKRVRRITGLNVL